MSLNQHNSSSSADSAGTPPSVPALMRKYGLHAKKGLGQHFLFDPNILKKIVSAAGLTAQDTVLEIGPGLGSLTAVLADSGARVVAVELDETMVNILQTELGHFPNLTIVHGDILTTQPASLLPQNDGPTEYKVVANLPYYITSAVIRHLLEAEVRPSRLVLTVQREVAQRIVAEPGDLSLLAVSIQFYGRPQLIARIPAGAFLPPPNVDSAVIRIDTFDPLPYAVADHRQFFRVVKAGFSQKRKQLHNALSAGLALPSEQVAAALNQAMIDPRRRAQTLSMDEWTALAAAFAELT
jgi:16S rRNA (adenine1518-N6/adenine1519-N6)-dimethyltransferase